MKNFIAYLFKDLKEPWRVFINIFFNPVVLITLILSIFGTYLSTLYYKDDTRIIAVLLSILASISAGILGSVAFDRYKEITGNNILMKKGKSAVRNLSLIVDQLHRLRIRLFEFNESKAKVPLEEIDHHLVTTEKSIISGIEDWVDMVPELNALAKISEFVVEKGNKIQKLLNEKKELEKELGVQDKTQKDKVSLLEERIKQKDQEVSRLYSEVNKLRGQQTSIAGATISSGMAIGSSLGGTVESLVSGNLSIASSRNCKRCGKQYQVSPWLVDLGICSQCSLLGF